MVLFYSVYLNDSLIAYPPPLLHPHPPSHLVGQDVDSLLQAAIFRVQQRRLLALEGAVRVGVLPELIDHGELRRRNQSIPLLL